MTASPAGIPPAFATTIRSPAGGCRQTRSGWGRTLTGIDMVGTIRSMRPILAAKRPAEILRRCSGALRIQFAAVGYRTLTTSRIKSWATAMGNTAEAAASRMRCFTARGCATFRRGAGAMRPLAWAQRHEHSSTNPHDTRMDGFNNGEGARLGGASGTLSISECFDKCENAAKQHKLYWWRKVPRDSGPARGLPSDFPGFTLRDNGTIYDGTLGASSPAPPTYRPGSTLRNWASNPLGGAK